MKIRSATKVGAKGSYSITRNSNVVSIWCDQGKDWRLETRHNFNTVREAKQFMRHPTI